jgi:hypothetical protein
MTRQQVLEEIGKALAVLTHQVEQENLSGMFSKNRIIEDILLPVFAILFSAPGLHNLNSVGSNNAHLDLGDDTTHLGIQVTAENSAEKITKTLTGVVRDGLYNDYHRIVIFVLKARRIRYTEKTKQAWSRICRRKLVFDPQGDIVELSTLLSQIAGLGFNDLLTVRNVIARTVVGEDYVDVLSQVREISTRHLSYEKKTLRYIPGVFIETRETKQLCRSFCYPVLFLQRSIESARRVNLASWNDFFAKAGLLPLDFPDLEDVPAGATTADAEAIAKSKWLSYAPLLETIKEYKYEGARRSPVPDATPAQLAFYEMNSQVLTNEFQAGVRLDVEDIREDLESTAKRILLITGAAGQGKTNLLCDLFENFLLKHEIPCAFVSGRVLSTIDAEHLEDALRTALFGKKVSALEDGIQLLSGESLRLNKPFVLMIDGLNEHRNISIFSQQLELVAGKLLEYPGIRLFLSCRTEFFGDRFSNLVDGLLRDDVMLLRSTERRLEDAEREELVLVYFEYFRVKSRRVGRQVRETLTKDMLLLRIFCEAYGARGKEGKYEQPDIRTLHRDELFELYLAQKLRKAGEFLQTLRIAPSPVAPINELKRVLDRCTDYMLKQGDFVGVPFRAIGKELEQPLYVLLDEELIIRKDASLDPSDPAAESVNFTFDELRDYMISRFIIEHVYPNGKAALWEALERLSPQRSPIEGVQRFLFYASRKPASKSFHAVYREHEWYTHLYPQEIFNIDQKHLEPKDLERVESFLAKLDWQAEQVAGHLAERWDPSEWPILHLGVLNRMVLSLGSNAYEALIESALVHPRFGDRPLAEELCALAEQCAKRLNSSECSLRCRELIRLLILLLPAGTDSRWTSPSLVVLDALLPKLTLEITEELLAFPDEKFPDHRRLRWRALFRVMEVRPDGRILTAAKRALAKLDTNQDDVKMELERLLDRFGSIGK